MIRDLLLNQKNLDGIAVIDGSKHYSYRDLAQRAYTIQKQLQEKQQGSIAVFLPNGKDYIAALFGIIMSGMMVFPLNDQLTGHELASLLTQASVHTVITSESYGSLFIDMVEAAAIHVIYVEDLPDSSDADESIEVNEIISVDAPMILLATSGTTGNVKIVQLSEKNVAASVFGQINRMDFTKTPLEEIRIFIGVPFFSSYGLLMLFSCMMQSVTIVVSKEAVTLDAIYKTIEENKVTHLENGMSVVLLMVQMAGRPIPYDISSLRHFGFGGSKISPDTLRRFTEAYPEVELCPGYGMTEAGPLIAKFNKKINMEKLDSAGIPVDCVELMIDVNGVLTDTPHTIGEIVVKGPNVMTGYYKNEGETRKILKDGYLHTGDIGYLDEDGYLYICGRKKNVIIVRGFNVYAEEVEECMLNSGLVKDCIVYGETDSFGNETVCADIIPMTGQVQMDKIRSHCKDHLASYKQPQRLHITDTIRKTATGKTERVKREVP